MELSKEKLKEFLVRYPFVSNKQLALEFGLKKWEPAYIAVKNNVRKKKRTGSLNKRKIWTEEEDQFLKMNFESMNDKSLANMIGRRVAPTKIRLIELGLRSSADNKPNSYE